MNENDILFMRRALALAEEGRENGEVAVGAVIVKDGVIIGEGKNEREKEKSALSHAEISAIENACRAVGDWRLNGCEMYVTLEPCPMCAGAILMSRISRLVFGAYSPDGAVISRIGLFDEYESRIGIVGGLLEDECKKLLPIK